MAPTQHKYDKIAAKLLSVSFLAGTVSSLTNFGPLANDVFNGPAAWLLAILFGVVVLAHYYYIGQGYRWAKVLFFILFGFSLLSLLIGFEQVAATQFTSLLAKTGFAVHWLTRIIAFTLLVMSFRSTRQPGA